ncbi:hypothetical protein FPQ18DRAFT_306381 [Pyronema domesticum]|nr:hypothetical protein FPQ18DRAFT_306381 [Pyronema domesticum]
MTIDTHRNPHPTQHNRRIYRFCACNRCVNAAYRCKRAQSQCIRDGTISLWYHRFGLPVVCKDCWEDPSLWKYRDYQTNVKEELARNIRSWSQKKAAKKEAAKKKKAAEKEKWEKFKKKIMKKRNAANEKAAEKEVVDKEEWEKFREEIMEDWEKFKKERMERREAAKKEAAKKKAAEKEAAKKEAAKKEAAKKESRDKFNKEMVEKVKTVFKNMLPRWGKKKGGIQILECEKVREMQVKPDRSYELEEEKLEAFAKWSEKAKETEMRKLESLI